MSTPASPVEWPAMTAPVFTGPSRDGPDCYEVHDHPSPVGDDAIRCAIYLRQANGLWPARTFTYDRNGASEEERQRLAEEFGSRIRAWQRKGRVEDRRADPSVALPVPMSPEEYSAHVRAEWLASKAERIHATSELSTTRSSCGSIPAALSVGFNGAVAEIMGTVRCIADEDGWRVPTKFGILRVWRPTQRHVHCYGVFGVFEAGADLATAAEVIGRSMNPLSGKYNALWADPNDALEDLCSCLNALGANRQASRSAPDGDHQAELALGVE